MRIVDSDQHLYEPRTLWLRSHRPGAARRGAAHRGRRDRHAAPALARPGARHRRGAGARPLGRDRRAAPPRARRPAAARALRRGAAARLLGAGGARRQARRARRRRGGAVPQLRPPLGAHAARARCRRCSPTWRPGIAGARRSRRTAAARCIRSRTARCATPSGSSAACARSPRAGVRLAMIAPALVDGRPLSHPAPRPHVGGVLPSRHHAGLPRRRSAAPVRRRLVHRPGRPPSCRRSRRCSSTSPPRSAAPT